LFEARQNARKHVHCLAYDDRARVSIHCIRLDEIARNRGATSSPVITGLPIQIVAMVAGLGASIDFFAKHDPAALLQILPEATFSAALGNSGWQAIHCIKRPAASWSPPVSSFSTCHGNWSL
jgi:hypothetical protein